MRNQKGKFIVIDGTDGAGKSTMARELAEYLQAKGIKVHHTREPGGTPLCESIRELLFSPSKMLEEQIDPDTELLLMFASRNQHLKTRIIPAIKKGEWVVCERWTSSTFAYQGVARGLGTKKILNMDNEFVSIKPDMTLIFDVSPEISRQRMGARDNLDYIEKEEQSFFEKVRQGYRLYAESCVEPAILVDASRNMESVKNEMIKTVIDRAGLKNKHQLTEQLSI